MFVVKAFFAALFGGVFGAIALPMLLYPLFLAAHGGRDMNGGIAMGMVTGIAPLGLFIGAAGGLILVLFLSRPDIKPEPQMPATSRRVPIILIVLFALASGYVFLLLFLQGPAGIRIASEPDLHFEFKTSVSSLVASKEFKPQVQLFGHAKNQIIPLNSTLKIDGDQAILKGRFQVLKDRGYENLRLRAVWSPDLIVDATVPLWPGAEVQPGWKAWDEVDYISMPLSNKTELGYSQKLHFYRYEVTPRD